jgi:hypothetical protein
MHNIYYTTVLFVVNVPSQIPYSSTAEVTGDGSAVTALGNRTAGYCDVLDSRGAGIQDRIAQPTTKRSLLHLFLR